MNLAKSAVDRFPLPMKIIPNDISTAILSTALSMFLYVTRFLQVSLPFDVLMMSDRSSSKTLNIRRTDDRLKEFHQVKPTE